MFNALDSSLFYVINEYFRNSIFDYVLPIFSYSLPLLIGVCCFVFFFSLYCLKIYGDALWRVLALVITIAVAFVISESGALLFKDVFERMRPYERLQSVFYFQENSYSWLEIVREKNVSKNIAEGRVEQVVLDSATEGRQLYTVAAPTEQSLSSQIHSLEEETNNSILQNAGSEVFEGLVNEATSEVISETIREEISSTIHQESIVNSEIISDNGEAELAHEGTDGTGGTLEKALDESEVDEKIEVSDAMMNESLEPSKDTIHVETIEPVALEISLDQDRSTLPSFQTQEVARLEGKTQSQDIQSLEKEENISQNAFAKNFSNSTSFFASVGKGFSYGVMTYDEAYAQGIFEETSSSMPSAFAANVLAITFIIALLFPKTAPWIYSIPFVTGWARIYTGNSFPMDIIIGWVWGILAVAIAWFICEFILRKLVKVRRI